MSYAKKEAKATRNWFIGASIVVAIIFLLFVIPTSLYSHYWYSQAAGLSKFLGWVVTIAWYAFVWWFYPTYRNRYQVVESTGKVFVFGGLLLIIFLLSGFNFDLPA